MFKRASQAPAQTGWPTLAHLILAAGTAIVLISAPISFEPDSLAVTWQAAHGKDGGGNGGGHGGGNGQGGGHGASDHGPGSQGVANARGRQGETRGADGEYRGLGAVVDDLRSGRAFGHERRDARIEDARQRYEQARGYGRPGEPGGRDDERQVAHRFSAAETHALIERGWRARAVDDGFANHGQRVRTMVELAKRLGYGARVGALQANFGTPYENDIARLEAELAEAQAKAAAGEDEIADEVARLEAELEAALAGAKPGHDPDHDWARADLDVNQDGVVDPRDLEALDAAAGSDAPAPATS